VRDLAVGRQVARPCQAQCLSELVEEDRDPVDELAVAPRSQTAGDYFLRDR
jgi:hypothetical protein